MRYAHKALGEQPRGAEVTVRLQGSAANVMLLDEDNYYRYRASRPFKYTGGLFRTSPVKLTVPRDGRWRVVVDLGGFRGRVRAQVEEVTPPEEAQAATTQGKGDAT